MNSRPVFHRRALAAILLIVSSSFVALSGVANAEPVSTTVDGVIYSPSGTGGGGDPYIATVMGHSGPDAVLTIPSSIVANGHTYSVTSIETYAFNLDTFLTSITIPNSVITIGLGAFDNTSLTSVTIPNSVTSIGDYAFNNDRELVSVIIGNSVTVIGTDAFGDDLKLVSVTIGNSVTSINDYAFSGDIALTSIIIPNSVISIGDRAFFGAAALTSIIIPNSVTFIGWNAFGQDSALTSVTIGNAVTSIGDYAFQGDTALTSVIIPNSVTSIGDYTFSGDTALTSINIPNSVTSIGDYAFQGDTALTSVIIPNSVTSIGDYAFSGDTALTSINIPNSVISIGVRTFFGAAALTSIIIPNSVTSIGASAFSGDTALTFINPSGFVATWTGAGVAYTTAQLRTATDIGAVTGTWAIVVHVTPIVYSKPTAPTNVVATMNNGSATISFTAGSSGNLSTYDEIDMFINGLSVGNVCNVTGASTCPISNLGPDVSFTFSVTAINSMGSAVSTVSNPVSYSSPVFVSATTTPPPTTTTTAPPVKRTIACVRGATSKKITAVSPVCPAGYKKK